MVKHIMLLCVLNIGCLSACPTCVGRTMHRSTAPFFSDEHYAKYPAPQEDAVEEYTSDETDSNTTPSEADR